MTPAPEGFYRQFQKEKNVKEIYLHPITYVKSESFIAWLAFVQINYFLIMASKHHAWLNT